MSVRCPRCDEVVPEKVFKEIQEWGPEAMKCPYCDCPLNKSIFEQRQWDKLFPTPEKGDDSVVKVVARKTREVAQQVKKSATDLKKDYLG